MIHIIDFAWHGSQTLFVECSGELEGVSFKGMVRIVDGMIYGDLVKESRSQLSGVAIEQLKTYLLEKYNTGQFH